MRYLLVILAAGLAALPAPAALKTQPVEYRHGTTVLEGYLACDAIRLLFAESFVKDSGKPGTPPAPAKAKVPEKVTTVLEYVDKHKKAQDGYEGGRSFGNFEKVLPQKDKAGAAIKYQEWDVNPHKPGVNRGAERLITGSDGSAHYTDDHYKTFTKIR